MGVNASSSPSYDSDSSLLLLRTQSTIRAGGFVVLSDRHAARSFAVLRTTMNRAAVKIIASASSGIAVGASGMYSWDRW